MNLLHTLGFGQMPAEAFVLVPEASQVIACENLSSSITWRNFRAPYRYHGWKRKWFPASLVVSNERLIAFQWSKRLINIQFTDPRFAQLKISVQGDMLIICHDASLFHGDWFGEMEYRFKTPEATRLLEHIRRAAAANGKHANRV